METGGKGLIFGETEKMRFFDFKIQKIVKALEIIGRA